MSEAAPAPDKKKRASKRYSYQRVGTTEIAGEAFEIQIHNISTTGLQFATRAKIATKEPICIKWTDSKYGVFNPTFLIVRQDHQTDNKEFNFFYGAQYCSLSTEVKTKLLELLKSFKEEVSNEIIAGDEKIMPRYLFKIIEQGPTFLGELIIQKNESNYFRSILANIPEYEKKAFEEPDENSKCIQQLASHHFHCDILISLIPVIVKNVDQVSTFLKIVNGEIEKINITENLIEKELKKVLESKLSDENKKAVQKQFNESSNRLFYSKQSLLQNIVQTFAEHVFDESEKGSFEKLNQSYETMISLTASVQEGAVAYSRKSKKPEEFSKVDFIADVKGLEEKKPRFFLFFMIFILLLVLSGVGFYYYDIDQQKKTITQAVGIDIEILEFKRIGSQLDMIFSRAEWKSLSKDDQKKVFEKITTYLSTRKEIRSVVMLDEAENIIKILYKDNKAQEPTN